MSKTILVAIDICYIISSFILFIIMIFAYSKLFNSNYAYMHTLGENWKRGPVISVNSNNYCNEGEESLITNSWPGTVEGCYCSVNFDLFKGPLRRGRCNRDRDNLLFCSTVAQKPQIRYTSWKGKQICVKRENKNYLDLTISSNEKYCPMNTRSCGVADSLNNVLCVPSTVACPLNYIMFLNSGQLVPKDMNYTQIDTKDGKLLFSNEATKEDVLNEFFISEGQPCANPKGRNYLQKPYILDPFYDNYACNVNISDFQYDERYKLVDSYKTYDLYRDNSLLPALKSLPEYPDPLQNNRDVSLYKRNYIGIDSRCLAEIKSNGVSTANLINDLTNIGSHMNSAVMLSLASMIMTIILFILTILFIVLLFVFKSDEAVTRLIFMIIPLILIIAIFIVNTILTSNLKAYSSDHEILSREECLDTLSHNAAITFYSNVSSGKGIAIFSSFLAGLTLVLIIVGIIFGYTTS